MNEKQKIIDSVVDSLEDKYGDGRARTLGSENPNKIHGYAPTGNLALDWVIGKRGIPLGRVSEIAGKYGSGKSSIVASIIANVQKQGGIGILCDTENSYDPSWAEVHGVLPDELIYLDPPHLQGVFDGVIAAINTIRKQATDVPIFIAVDSVSAVPTAAELETEDSTSSKQSAEHAKIISEGLRRASGLINRQSVSLMFVSQLKDNPRASWGNTTHKIGGNAINFSAGLLLELTRTGYITVNEKKIGQKIQVASKKNKFNMVDPMRVRTFDLYYGEGFRPKEILLDFMVEQGTIKATKGWYEWDGSKLRKEDVVSKLDDSLIDEMYEKLGIK